MNVKLADFGTAMRLGEAGGATLTSDAPFAGTLDYLAPEALGRLDADGQCTASASEKTDVWAMGVMIHTMLFAERRLPFPENGARDVEAQRRVLSAALALGNEGFLDVLSEIGPACLELTQACLHPLPENRPSATSLLQTVKASCYAQISTAAPAPVATSSSQEPPPYSAKYDSTMPPGWVRVDVANGQHYYVDHINRRTTWTAPTVESPSQGELPAVSRESSAICMLSVASQEAAEDEVLAAVPAPLPTAAMLPSRMRRQVTFQSSQDKLDLLFMILSFIPISELFRARRVCKSWRQRIDGADRKGREWWEVCVQHGMQGRGYDARVDWKEVLNVGSLLGPLTHAPRLFSSPTDPSNADGNIVTAEWMTILLSNLRRAAVIASASGTLFKKFVSLHSGIFPKCCEIMYKAFTQKPPNNHSALAYDWWTTSTSEVAAEITANLAKAPLEAREAGAVSFDSYIKKMIIALAYLERFYIQRLSLPTLSGVAKPVQAALRLDLGLPAAVVLA
mmetsp:Transcript_7420/g.19470  ORF Transcript_7420/g.19470 Transcript_7420/m.19470 type:complete len:509 (+) Transcript_7420:652-2178(+)